MNLESIIDNMLGAVFSTAGGGAPTPLLDLVDSVANVVGDVLPFALGIFGILIAVSLIPRLVYKFL